MVVSFTFFYTSVLFEQQNYGDNLKKVGAQIPGVHTGEPTQKYLNKVQQRITLPGAFFLGLVAAMPFFLSKLLALFNVASSSSSTGLFLVSSAGLLIVVGVVRDTFLNIEAELKLHGYQDSLLVVRSRGTESWRPTSFSSDLPGWQRDAGGNPGREDRPAAYLVGRPVPGEHEKQYGAWEDRPSLTWIKANWFRTM